MFHLRVPQLAVLGLILFPLAAARASAQPAPAAESVAKTYATLCASCHGDKLQGARGPSLVDDVWLHGSEDADITRSIRDGWAAGGMPSFKAGLSDLQVRALVVYIRETRGGGPNPISSNQVPPLPTSFTSERHNFRLETVVDGIDTPWGLVFLPDGRFLFTDRVGLLRSVGKDGLEPTVIGGLPPIWVRQDGGLMDIALHPDYAKNGWIYLSFTEPGGTVPNASTTRIIRARIRDNQLVDQETIFKAPPALYWENNSHYGSRFIFDRQGYLYYSIGDRGHMQDAQDLKSPYGKLHRVHDDGRVPADNPFVNTPGALGSIWTWGHRNQQGLAFHPVTGELWASEHGPRGGDELNLIVKGHNYGWPVITRGMDYDGTAITTETTHEGMEQPIVDWTPSIAPSGIGFYTGDRFPGWKNNLFVTALAGQQLVRLEIDKGQVTHQEVLLKGLSRARSVVTGPDGYLYVVLNVPGRIVRIVPIP